MGKKLKAIFGLNVMKYNYLPDKRRISSYIISLTIIMLVTGCSVYRAPYTRKSTKIIPVLFGQTTRTPRFKVRGSKPYVHILWEVDIKDGARCRIIIIYTAQTAKRVYQNDFVYKKGAMIGGYYNYSQGNIVEFDPDWYLKIGEYYVELFVDGRRMSHDTFVIIP